MERIDSFNVNHNTLMPGIYISRRDGDITTYDLRFKVPNSGDYLQNAAMHTIEHIMATYLRNGSHKNDIIYFGPMGCRTGFYLLVRNMDVEEVISAVREGLRFISDFDGPIPGVSKIECGNYLEHNLGEAKRECFEMLNHIKDYTICGLTYI